VGTVFADVRVVRVAARVRWARETLTEVSTELCEVGREDLLFEVTNLEMQLHELHLQLMQPLAKAAPAPDKQERLRERRSASVQHAPLPS
jgi:hypothetical protein